MDDNHLFSELEPPKDGMPADLRLSTDTKFEMCPCCEQRIRKPYARRMCRMTIQIMREIAEINRRHEWAKLQQDHKLIKDDERDWTIQTDATHGRIPRLYGLLDYHGNNSGKFKINRKGVRFLQGLELIPSRLWLLGKEVHSRTAEEELVSIEDVKGVILDKAYWDAYPLTH